MAGAPAQWKTLDGLIGNGVRVPVPKPDRGSEN
jgi:hypothetical protein